MAAGIPGGFFLSGNVTMCQNAYDIGLLAHKLKEIGRKRARPAGPQKLKRTNTITE